MTEHTPTPWSVVRYGDGDSLVIHDARGDWRVCFMATPGQSSDIQDIEANAAFIVEACNSHDALIAALDDLQRAEAEYRYAHDLHGDGSMATGRAWDLMRRSGDKARAMLRSMNPDEADILLDEAAAMLESLASQLAEREGR